MPSSSEASSFPSWVSPFASALAILAVFILAIQFARVSSEVSALEEKVELARKSTRGGPGAASASRAKAKSPGKAKARGGAKAAKASKGGKSKGKARPAPP